MTSTHRRLLAVLAAAAALVATPVPASAATPAATVTVDRADGLPAGEPTTLQVSGTGFQVVRGGFGGVYVLFGWVDDPAGGTWRPSAGGVTGTDLRYAVDEAARDNAGYQVFVAFPGASTAVEANGGTLADDGSWSATLTVPGARITAVDTQGGTSEVDCTQVTCGVLTIGAHGVANAHNETFTPVAFGAAPDAATPVPEATDRTTDVVASPDPTDVATTAPPAADDAASDGPRPLPVLLGLGGPVLIALVGVAWWRSRRGTAAP